MNNQGQPRPDWTVVLRRRPARIVEGRPEGGYTDEFEIICCDCGDDPDLDYREVSPALQRIRGSTPSRRESPRTSSMSGSTPSLSEYTRRAAIRCARPTATYPSPARAAAASTRSPGPGRLASPIAAAAARPGQWSGYLSRPPPSGRIRLTCCCAATITWRPGPPWPPPTLSRLTRQAQSWNQHQPALGQQAPHPPIPRCSDNPPRCRRHRQPPHGLAI
jgi:hypothetical protein